MNIGRDNKKVITLINRYEYMKKKKILFFLSVSSVLPQDFQFFQGVKLTEGLISVIEYSYVLRSTG